MDNTSRNAILKHINEKSNRLNTAIMDIAVDCYDRKADRELIGLLADIAVLVIEYKRKAR